MVIPCQSANPKSFCCCPIIISKQARSYTGTKPPTRLMSDRTRVMNIVRSLLDKYDVKCDYDNIFGVKGTRWLKSLKLSDNDQILLYECVMQIEFLNTEIKNIESKITSETSKNESVKILMSMTGIDYFSAMMIASEIGDITRFSAPR